MALFRFVEIVKLFTVEIFNFNAKYERFDVGGVYLKERRKIVFSSGKLRVNLFF